MFEDELETLYGLIPKPPPVIVKDPLHVSKFQDQTEFVTAKKRGHGTMGEPADKIKKRPDQYLKAHSIKKDLPPRTRAMPHGNETLQKPPVPTAKEAIKIKEHPKRNFVVENWKQAPKTRKLHPEKKETWYTEKKDYGKTPAYLDRVKAQVEAEAEYWEELRDSMAPEDTETRCKLLTEEEREAILEGLYENMAELKRHYAALSFGQDNLSFRHKKEEMERQMAQIEIDIKTFERPNVYVTEI